MYKVSVIILNWNGENWLKKFLPSIIANTNATLANIIVADNNSTDNSIKLLIEEFPDVKLIQFDKNYGFAAGYNKAIEEVTSEIVVLLNSDVEVSPFWLEPLIETLDSSDKIVAVQPKIKAWKNKNYFEYAGASGGFIDVYGFPFCRGRIVDTTEEDIGQYDDIREVFWCSGAALVIKRDAYIEIGGLDQNFFAHMEEIDLCWRLRNKGAKLMVCPKSTVYHYGGGSLPMNHPHKLYLNYRNNLLMMYKNLSAQEWKKLILIRMCIDFASALFFFIKGERKNACAVIKAYRDFYKFKQQYAHNTEKSNRSLIYKRCILFQYFVKKNKIFSILQR